MPETVRVDPNTHAALGRVAKSLHVPRTEALRRIVKGYERKLFLKCLHAQFEALRSDPKAWAEEQAERDVWDTTLTDGLKDE
jgi:hypothetical protein